MASLDTTPANKDDQINFFYHIAVDIAAALKNKPATEIQINEAHACYSDSEGFHVPFAPLHGELDIATLSAVINKKIEEHSIHIRIRTYKRVGRPDFEFQFTWQPFIPNTIVPIASASRGYTLSQLCILLLLTLCALMGVLTFCYIVVPDLFLPLVKPLLASRMPAMLHHHGSE